MEEVVVLEGEKCMTVQCACFLTHTFYLECRFMVPQNVTVTFTEHLLSPITARQRGAGVYGWGSGVAGVDSATHTTPPG